MEPLSAFRLACNTRAQETLSWLSSWACVGNPTSLLLRDAHLLFGIEAVSDFIVADTLDYWGHFPKDDAGDFVLFSYIQGAGRTRLISHLRDSLRPHLVDGVLIGTCISADAALSGRRMRIPADRWRAIDLDFENSQIYAAGKIVGIDVMVERPVVQQSTPKPVSLAAVRRETQSIIGANNGKLHSRDEMIRRVKTALPDAREKQIRVAISEAKTAGAQSAPAHRPKKSGA